MNGDISLTETLGGLRIANPDSDAASPSPPPDRSASTNRPPLPPSSSHSSSSTVTAKPESSSQRPSQPGPPSTNASSGSLGFDPSSFSTSNPTYQQSPLSAEPVQYDHARLSHRQSMPLSYQAQQQAQFPPGPMVRSYPPQQQPAVRPMSGIYNHPNLSSSSQRSTQGTYRYNDDSIPQPSAIGVQRSDSRAAAAILHGGGLPSREPSRRDPAYMNAQQMHGGNGPAPPRRSSRKLPVGSGPNGPVSGSPYAVEGGPPPSSDDWQERGAAVNVRQEVDASGRTVQRVMKKGVKDFNFGRPLGEGSYSSVIAATDRQTLREYAIKVLDKRHIIKEKKVKYVNIEKDALNRLTEHPGIVRLYYTFQDERSLYFVLDLATGGELLGILKKMSTFDEECTRFYGAQVLDAVNYMHSKGIIHRDLKPENILLDAQMHVKITDFGTAKILDLSKASSNGNGIIGGDPLDGAGTDRAVSFVGTAEYVSPELLTDKNACKASDLWAFGCIIYQLLAGRPPFKAGNEYQTFQKIVALDYTFPDGFPPIARDLVERLLVLDPSKRLPIEHIKNHAFFDGITWGKGLWKQKAPRLKAYVPPSAEPIRLNGPSVSTPSRPPPRLVTELPPPSQLDIEWSPVLTRNNERILKLGNLIVTSTPAPHSPSARGFEQPETPKKFSRFFGGSTTKKRQRLVMVTSSARIVLAAAGGEEKKAKMEVSLMTPGTSWKTYQDSKGLTAWCVDTRDKHLVFEDPKATTSDPDGSKYSAQEWMDALQQAQDFAISHSVANSYSGDSGFNDLSSTLSSPTSTLGGGGAIEGVDVPRSRHLTKHGDGDNESVKGRKRFSKRHSKNGLAAVF